MSGLLSAFDLRLALPRSGGLFRASEPVHALNGVDLSLGVGEVLAVVGESGSGKTSLARVLVGLVPPTHGEVHFRGQRLTGLKEHQLRPLRRHLQLVFQDPSSALNPRMTVEAALAEALRFHRLVPPEQVSARVDQLLQEVGLAAEHRPLYPHQLSGGQKQRVAIARALSVEPQVLVADEVVSALDVSVRAQILELLLRLKRDRNLAMVFITHDLSLVPVIADRVLVLYLGRSVEVLPSAQLSAALHPYTRALLAAAPSLDRAPGGVVALGGEPPSPIQLPPGCAFAGRCPRVQPSCTTSVPPLVSLTPEHQLACPVVAAHGPPGPA